MTVWYGIYVVTQSVIAIRAKILVCPCYSRLVAHTLCLCVIVKALVPSLIIFSRALDIFVILCSTWVWTPLCIYGDWWRTFLASLCCDDDYTIGTTSTIKSGRSSILQYCHRSNIVRVDIIHVSIPRRTIDNNQWGATSIDWTDTSNTDFEIFNTWLTSLRVNLYTRNFTCQSLNWFWVCNLSNIFCFHDCCWTCKGTLLCSTISYNNDFIQSLVVWIHNNFHVRSSLNSLRVHTNIWNL